MLDKLRQIVLDLASGGSEHRRFDDNDYRLAAAALLVHLMSVDGEVSGSERSKLRALLKSRFELDEPAVEELVTAATRVEGEAVDIYRFTSAADLKSLHHLPQARARDFKSISGTGIRKVAGALFFSKFVSEVAATFDELRKEGTSRIMRAVDEKGRARIVEMMWELVYADDHVSEFEESVIWRTADLLGVSSNERIALKNRVAAARAGGEGA